MWVITAHDHTRSPFNWHSLLINYAFKCRSHIITCGLYWLMGSWRYISIFLFFSRFTMNSSSSGELVVSFPRDGNYHIFRAVIFFRNFSLSKLCTYAPLAAVQINHAPSRSCNSHSHYWNANASHTDVHHKFLRETLISLWWDRMRELLCAAAAAASQFIYLFFRFHSAQLKRDH